MPPSPSGPRTDVRSLEDAEEALRRIDRELRVWESTKLASRVEESPSRGVYAMWAELAILAGLIAAAAWLAPDVAAGLPHVR